MEEETPSQIPPRMSRKQKALQEVVESEDEDPRHAESPGLEYTFEHDDDLKTMDDDALKKQLVSEVCYSTPMRLLGYS